VACKAIAAWDGALDVVLVGDEGAIVRAAGAVDLPVVRVPTLSTAISDAVPYWVPPTGEPVEVAAVRAVTLACLSGTLAGLVTGPIHKARLGAQGFPYPGHTNFLGHLCGVERPVMAFVGGGLRVALVTVHLPLREVADAVTTAAVRHTLDAVARASVRHLGLPAPRIAVCGLNPHAGDDGLLGDEDRDQIAPAVVAARPTGMDAVGPISSETAFRWAASGRVDWVVAMYHDQGLAPLKLVDFGR